MSTSATGFQGTYNTNPGATAAWLRKVAKDVPETGRWSFIHGARLEQAGFPTPVRSKDVGNYEQQAREVIPDTGKFDVEQVLKIAEEQRQLELMNESQQEEFWYQARRRNEQAKSDYGGTRTDAALTDVGGRTPTVTKESIERKAAYVQSPTAQYASEQSFQQAAGSVQQYRVVDARGVIPSVISQERIPEPQPQQKPLLTLGGAIAGLSPGQLRDPFTGQDTRGTGTRIAGKIPLFDPVSGKPNIVFTTPPVSSEIKRDPKYGFMVRQDIAERQQATRREELLRSSVPGTITLSSLSMKSRALGERYGEKVRGFTVDTSRLPQEIKESPGFKGGKYLFGLGRESTARVIEFGGLVAPTTELIGKTAIKQPSKLPEMVVVGGLEFVGGTARQAKENPAQLVSDLVVTAAVFKGIGRGARVVKTTAPKLGISKGGFKRFLADERAYLSIEKDPWAKQPTMRQSAEAKGEKLSRAVTEYKAPKKEPAGISVSTQIGKQEQVLLMEKPIQEVKTVQSSVLKGMKEQALWRPSYETIYEAKLKKPSVQLMSQAERDVVIARIKATGGLYRNPQTLVPVEEAKTSSALRSISKSASVAISKNKQVNAFGFGNVAISKSITKTVPVAISESKSISRAIPVSIFQVIPIQKQKASRQKQVINIAKQQQKQLQKQLSITVPTQKESDKSKFGFGPGLRTPPPSKPTGETSIIFKIPEIKVPRTPKNPPRDTPRIRPPRTQPPRNPPPRTPTIRKPPKPKKSQNTFGFKKPKKGRSKSSKFMEITPVRLPSAMLGTLRTRAKAKPKAKPRKQTRKQKTNRRKHNK